MSQVFSKHSIRTRRPHGRLRTGYTLVEVIVATASATILIGGMAGSLLCVTSAFDDGDSEQVKTVRAGKAADAMMTDLQYATSFSEQTANSVTFAIPDRDGDGIDETVRYAWSGVSGDPLTKEFNGSSPSILIGDIKNLNFTYLTRSVAGVPPPVVVTASIQFEEFSEAAIDSRDTSLTIQTPGSTASGDLLIAMVATDGNQSGSLAAPSGWNVLDIGNGFGRVTLGVWWKIASATEPASHTYTWQGNEEAYGTIMRFTGHNPLSPINTFATQTGWWNSPSSPAVTTTEADCVILRLGAFDDDDITIDRTGLSGHTDITMDESGSGGGTVSGGAGYTSQASAGSSGTANFSLTRYEQYRTLTLAIEPSRN